MSIQDLVKKAKEQSDHTQTTNSDFEYSPPEAGAAIGVFREYIELGKQKQPDYQGKPKPDAEEVRLVFALTTPKHTKEVEVEGGTKKYQETIGFNVAIKLGDKAKFKRIFNAMRYGRDNITHMAEMLGEKFRFHITHTKSDKSDRVYANLWSEDGSIGIFAPVIDDPIAGTTTDIRDKIPGSMEPLKIFLFDNPTKESWDSLFIDGERTIKGEDGKEKTVSKNWLQERILSAQNFNGSALHSLLEGVSGIHQEAQKQTDVKVEEQGEELPDNNSSADEALAALGLG